MYGQPARFRAERYEIGMTGDGRRLVLMPVRAADATALSADIVTFGPWTPDYYAVDTDHLARSLLVTGDGAVRYQIQCGETPAGLVIVRSPWLAGPYLQLLAVLPAFQRQRIGRRVLAWLDAEAHGVFPNIWLCVSTFNARARAFYEAHGYAAAATIDALVKPEIDEVLMRKRI